MEGVRSGQCDQPLRGPITSNIPFSSSREIVGDCVHNYMLAHHFSQSCNRNCQRMVSELAIPSWPFWSIPQRLLRLWGYVVKVMKCVWGGGGSSKTKPFVHRLWVQFISIGSHWPYSFWSCRNQYGIGINYKLICRILQINFKQKKCYIVYHDTEHASEISNGILFIF